MNLNKFAREVHVRPHARAGVEMKILRIKSAIDDVRPHARAGVEITSHRRGAGWRKSSPSCEGGS